MLVIALALFGGTARPSGAVDECRGIKACAAVEGPWVIVRSGVESDFLLTCPKRGVVAGVDAAATTTSVRLSFDGRLGSPVSPGVTTTSNAYFRGILVRGRIAAFQPWLGCIAVGGGGRSTVSARVRAGPVGPALVRRARILWLRPGETKTATIGCPAGERLVGGWDAIAFLRKPVLRDAPLVHARYELAGRKVVARIDASDALPATAHALAEVGAACAP